MSAHSRLFFCAPSQATLDHVTQRTIRGFAKLPQLFHPALGQGLRGRLVGNVVSNIAFDADQDLPHRAALVLMGALFAARDVLPAALVVFAIGIAAVAFVTLPLLVLWRFDRAQNRLLMPRQR